GCAEIGIEDGSHTPEEEAMLREYTDAGSRLRGDPRGNDGFESLWNVGKVARRKTAGFGDLTIVNGQIAHQALDHFRPDMIMGSKLKAPFDGVRPPCDHFRPFERFSRRLEEALWQLADRRSAEGNKGVRPIGRIALE